MALGIKTPFPSGHPASLADPSPGPYLPTFPKPMPFWPHRWSLSLSLKQIMLILAPGPLPVLFPLPSVLLLEIFARLLSPFRAQLKSHFLGRPPLSTPQKPSAAPDLHYFLHRLCHHLETIKCVYLFMFSPQPYTCENASPGSARISSVLGCVF